MLDLFYPGHYHRIIRDVQVTIPGVTGPYVNVAAELLLKSSRVYSDASSDTYRLVARTASDRIATSSARSDSGRVVLTFGADMLTHFEGAGVASTWELRLPSAIRVFDYSLIPDIILGITYTARSSAESGRVDAESRVKTWLEDSDDPKLRLVSLRSEFPDTFAQLRRGDDSALRLVPELFPYHALNPDETEPIDIVSVAFDGSPKIKLTHSGLDVTLEPTGDLGSIRDVVLRVGYARPS